jgi:RND superfamily putative drug exporter
VFVSLHFVVIREMGLGLAVAILVDATIVRSLLLPSIMKLLGDWNWYLPRFLDWIPRITLEGEPGTATPAGRAWAGGTAALSPDAAPSPSHTG